MVDLAACLLHLHPDEPWILNGETYEGLDWQSVNPKPSEDELLSVWPEVLARRAEEEEEQQSARRSALGKLQALGLTEAEALALVGGL